MRILHFSDTHLGFQAFDRVNAEGINAREQDVYDAFGRVVERILAEKPDVVIHSGDFFHRPSPSNRALTFGLEQLKRLCDARIPVVIIAGNHETPKTIYNSPILRALRNLDCVYPIFGETWEKFEFDGTVVHGVPHINDNRILYRELERLEPVAGKFNILMLHTSLGKKFLMEEYGEQVFPAEFEAKLADFQYIALGHWHNFQKIDLHPNAWYSGSTERLSDTEIGAEKGFLKLTFTKPDRFRKRDERNDTDLSVTFEAIPTRPWLSWEMNRCCELSVAEIEAALEKFISENDTRDAMVSLLFNDIRPEQTLELGNLRLRQLFPDAFQLIFKRKTWSDSAFVRGIEVGQFDSLDKIFADYLRSKYPDDEATAGKLVERAAGYFASETQG
ncbi:MAG: exonuclease SbcCD subunit D [Haliscomenobacteraceae bacterium CHB4]|nr:3',5'-cyclic adenosine monophosphate phosphodiesterase CpdA [Saprospiraceae bacterium]MCE7923619.1 exonuclease SbcCD subunit D [Haliscomenobacteraceae bacterium CHB4]